MNAYNNKNSKFFEANIMSCVRTTFPNFALFEIPAQRPYLSSENFRFVIDWTELASICICSSRLNICSSHYGEMPWIQILLGKFKRNGASQALYMQKYEAAGETCVNFLHTNWSRWNDCPTSSGVFTQFVSKNTSPLCWELMQMK